MTKFLNDFRELSVDEEMKNILEETTSVPTTPINPNRLRQRPVTQLAYVYFLNTELKFPQLNKLGRSLGFKLTSSHTNQVTHIVVKLNEANSGIKKSFPAFYSAVLLGQFIVDYKC